MSTPQTPPSHISIGKNQVIINSIVFNVIDSTLFDTDNYDNAIDLIEDYIATLGSPHEHIRLHSTIIVFSNRDNHQHLEFEITNDNSLIEIGAYNASGKLVCEVFGNKND